MDAFPRQFRFVFSPVRGGLFVPSDAPVFDPARWIRIWLTFTPPVSSAIIA
jgi:hypothetical protein